MTTLGRFLVLMHRGVQSDTYPCPDWYALIQAAKYLECKPWELMEQSIVWRQWAHKAMEAEAEARKTLENHK